MKIEVQIEAFRTVNELSNYWDEKDYRKLLEAFDFDDANQIESKDLIEMLHMAITDFEPAEAAQVLLNYKLSNKLSKGQIENISYEMIEDRVAEEYPDTTIHYDLFNINQLLYKAFRGKFPNTEATIMEVSLNYKGEHQSINKEIMIKALHKGLKANCLINRLYEDQLLGAEKFTDAERVIWRLNKTSEKSFEIVTSKYLIEKEDFENLEYVAEIKFHKEQEEQD